MGWIIGVYSDRVNAFYPISIFLRLRADRLGSLRVVHDAWPWPVTYRARGFRRWWRALPAAPAMPEGRTLVSCKPVMLVVADENP